MKVNLGNTNVMVSGGITTDGLSKSMVDPCGVCDLRVRATFCVHNVVSGSTVDVAE